MNDAAFIGLLRVVVKRKGDLEGQLTLEKHRKDVEEEVARLKGVDTATSYRKATDTGKITIKSAELMRTCVTQAVEKRFEEECKNLKLKKIALRDIGGAKGRLRHRPSLTGTAASTRLTDVLSEFQESYGKCSQWARRHNKSAEISCVAPGPEELESELKLAREWLKRVKTYSS